MLFTSSPSDGGESQPTLRSVERRLVALRAAGPSLELAVAGLTRAEILIAIDESPREVHHQLEEVLTLAIALGEREALLLAARTLAQRARYHLRDGVISNDAEADLQRAAELVGQLTPHATLEEAELEVELWTQRGRLLVLQQRPGRREALETALRLARALPPERGWLHVLRARRELSVAMASEDVALGLAELDEAETEVEGRELPPTERDLLLSTRAELLANGDRVREALRLLQVPGEPPEWTLAQRAATLELAGRADAARRVGLQLIEQRAADLDPRDVDSCHRLAEAIMSQVQRCEDPEERAGYARRILRLFEDFSSLPSRSLRLSCQAREVIAQCLEDPEEASELLLERVRLLEGLVRDTRLERDEIELIRAFLQSGDVLLRLEEEQEARRHYQWGVDAIRRLDPQHPFVLDVLPLALNALGHALATEEQWHAARRRLDEAAAGVAAHNNPGATIGFAEVLLFHAICCVNEGDPAGAVHALQEHVEALVSAFSEATEVSSELLDTLVAFYVLQAEVLVDHLDRVDEALACYDRAIELRELDSGQGTSLASILGAKGSVLTEHGRAEEALPIQRTCLELFSSVSDDPEVVGDRVLATLNVAASLSALDRPREALQEVTQAANLLDAVEDPEGFERQRLSAIRSHLHLERGEGLLRVGHPLLAVDELARSIDLCRALLEDEESEAQYEARLRLPRALLQRARCWLETGEHAQEATRDLREARALYELLVADESRPAHRRQLSAVIELQRTLNGAGARAAADSADARQTPKEE